MKKLTVNTSEVRVGDEVVGFVAKVASVTVDGPEVNVVFADGERWSTSTHFETTVLRPEGCGHAGNPDVLCSDCGW